MPERTLESLSLLWGIKRGIGPDLATNLARLLVSYLSSFPVKSGLELEERDKPTDTYETADIRAVATWKTCMTACIHVPRVGDEVGGPIDVESFSRVHSTVDMEERRDRETLSPTIRLIEALAGYINESNGQGGAPCRRAGHALNSRYPPCIESPGIYGLIWMLPSAVSCFLQAWRRSVHRFGDPRTHGAERRGNRWQPPALSIDNAQIDPRNRLKVSLRRRKKLQLASLTSSHRQGSHFSALPVLRVKQSGDGTLPPPLPPRGHSDTRRTP